MATNKVTGTSTYPLRIQARTVRNRKEDMKTSIQSYSGDEIGTINPVENPPRVYSISIYIYTWVSMEVSNSLVSWVITYNLFRGLTTYLYWGYNLVTKYHGHPSKNPDMA